MGKKSGKKHKKRRAANVSPLEVLRPNLDRLFNDSAFLEKKEEEIKESLNSFLENLKGEDVLPIFLKSYHDAPSSAQNHLEKIIPQWLEEKNYQSELQDFYQNDKLEGDSEKYVLAWMEKLGADISVLQKNKEKVEFYKSFYLGNESQGMIVVFWYTNSDKRAVRGMSFLLDYHRPWKGAVKKILVFPERYPWEAEKQFVDFWGEKEMPITQMEETAIKIKILEALQANEERQIPMPSDFIDSRDLFFKYIFALPDTPQTPSFTSADLELLIEETS